MSCEGSRAVTRRLGRRALLAGAVAFTVGCGVRLEMPEEFFPANDNSPPSPPSPPAAPARKAAEQPPPAAAVAFPVETRDQRELLEFYGDPRDDANIVRVEAPWLLHVAGSSAIRRHFWVHEKVAATVGDALAEIRSLYSLTEIERLGFASFGGDRVLRKMTGASRWSLHAWGVAIDFDPLRNRYEWNRTRASLAHPDCEAFWQAWEKRGWFSLGRERDFDWMHIQAARRTY